MASADRSAGWPPAGWRRLAVVAALVALEGLALIGAAAVGAVETGLGTAGDAVRALGALALTALAGAGVLVVARGVQLGRRWSRAPAVVTQLFALVLILPLTSERAGLGWPLALLVAGLLVALLTPSMGGLLRD